MTTLIDLLEEELLELQKENPLLTENVANEIVLLVKNMIDKKQIPNESDISTLFNKILISREE